MTSPNSPAGRPSASLHFAVGELSGKVDQILLTLLPQMNALDTRVSTLEAFRWQMLGGGAILVTALGSWELIRYVSIR